MERSTHEVQNLVLLVSWLINISLTDANVKSCLSQSFVEQMLYVDDTLDLLRPEATLLSRVGCRKGLPVQPYFWALTLAVIDITNLLQRGVTRWERLRSCTLLHWLSLISKFRITAFQRGICCPEYAVRTPIAPVENLKSCPRLAPTPCGVYPSPAQATRTIQETASPLK